MSYAVSLYQPPYLHAPHGVFVAPVDVIVVVHEIGDLKMVKFKSSTAEDVRRVLFSYPSESYYFHC